jgi:gliding motility-associated-like protein
LVFYFDALLDNASQGQNSSPIFVSEPVRAFCVGNPFNWKQTTIEADGDSVVYSLINCRENAYPNQTDIPFDAGWTAQQPVTSTYFNLNPNTGLISFLPTNQEIDVLSILVEEYRYDSTWGYWFKVGSASRDMMISISALCNPSAMSGVQYDSSTYPIDTVTGFPYVEVDCADSAFTLKFHINLDGTSINDIDFRMTNTMTNQPEAIQSIWSALDVNLETDSVVVNMLFPFSQEGDYYLYSKKGNDGNTLVNKCGIPMTEFDTILVKVGPCPEPPPPGELPDIPYGGEPIPQPTIETPTPIFPNVITPNEDGINDYFIIQEGELFTQIELTILNRWGNVVYYTNDYKNDFGGKLDVSDGVYFYVANLYFEPTDAYLTYTGDLTINK